jgi:phosphate transport system permease protein
MNKSALIDPKPTDWKGVEMQRRIAKRYGAERRFKAFGLGAVVLSSVFLAFLLFTMVGNALGGFTRTEIATDFDFPALTAGTSVDSISGERAEAGLNSLDLPGIIALAADDQLGKGGSEIFSREATNELRAALKSNPQLLSQKTRFWLPTKARVHQKSKIGLLRLRRNP